MGKLYNSPTLALTSYFDILASAPLDNRIVVLSTSDLIDNSIWNSYVYKGMLVSVVNEDSLYMYIGDTGKASDITNINKWKVVAAGSVDASLNLNGELVITQGGETVATINTKDKVINSGTSISPTKKGNEENVPTGALNYKLDGEWIYKESSEYFIYWTPSITANANLTGALNSTNALNTEQAIIYNSKLNGAVKEGDPTPADYLTKVGSAAEGAKVTAAEAIAYNAALNGAKQGGNTLEEKEARTYNATLPGAYSIKIVLSDLTGDLTDDILKRVYLKLNITNNLTPVIIPASSLVDIYTANNTHNVDGNLVNNDIQITITDDKKISASISDGTISSSKLSLTVQTSLEHADSALQNVSIDAVGQSLTIDESPTEGNVINKLYYSNEEASETSDTVKLVIFGGDIADSYVSRQGEAAKSEDTTKYYSYDGIATAANVKKYVSGAIENSLTWN